MLPAPHSDRDVRWRRVSASRELLDLRPDLALVGYEQASFDPALGRRRSAALARPTLLLAMARQSSARSSAFLLLCSGLEFPADARAASAWRLRCPSCFSQSLVAQRRLHTVRGSRKRGLDGGSRSPLRRSFSALWRCRGRLLQVVAQLFRVALPPPARSCAPASMIEQLRAPRPAPRNGWSVMSRWRQRPTVEEILALAIARRPRVFF